MTFGHLINSLFLLIQWKQIIETIEDFRETQLHIRLLLTTTVQSQPFENTIWSSDIASLKLKIFSLFSILHIATIQLKKKYTRL